MKPDTENAVQSFQQLAKLAMSLGRTDLADKYIEMANRTLYLDSLITDAENDVLNYG